MAGFFQNQVLGAGSNVASAIASGGFSSSMATNVTSGLGSIATSLSGVSSSAISSITNGVDLNKGQFDSAKGLVGSAFSAITDSFKSLKAGVPQDLKAIAQKNTAEQIATDAKPIGSVASLPGELTKAQTILSAASANIPGLATAGSSLPVVGAAITNLSASLTSGSGLNALPGGVGAVSTVVNNATGSSLSLPSLAGITSAAQTASTSMLNGISSANALSSMSTSLSVGNSAISGTITKLSTNLPNLTSGTQSLSALASTGLSAGAAASLAASINSLNTAGSNPIKMPTVAINTTDRSEVTAQVSNLIKDKKVPTPDFSGLGPAASATNAAELIKTKRAEYFALQAQYEKEQPVRKAEIDAEVARYQEAKNNLPQGDPELTSMKTIGKKNAEAYNLWVKEQLAKIEAKRLEINELQRAEGQAIFNQTSAAARQ